MFCSTRRIEGRMVRRREGRMVRRRKGKVENGVEKNSKRRDRWMNAKRY